MPSAHRLAFVPNSIFTKQPKSGFTLVELLVVITLIAILSVIGVTVFTGIQKNARDTKRKGDVNAISKAFEVNKTATGYINIVGTQFSSGSVPIDPKQTVMGDWNTSGCGDPAAADGYKKLCWYCINVNGSGTGVPGYCNSSSWSAGDGNWGNSIVTSWIVCANLENSPGYYCRGSQY